MRILRGPQSDGRDQPPERRLDLQVPRDETRIVLSEAIVGERRAFAETLRTVGPHAATLIEEWTAHDIAAHVISLDQLAGLPTFLARVAVANGIRLNDVAGRFADRSIRRPKRHGFDWAVEQLDRAPPSLLLRDSVATVGMFEVFVHHEDVRRASLDRRPRPSPEELSPVVEWLLRYHRRLVQGVELVIRTPLGENAIGTGPIVTLEGPVEEVVLWLAGRREASEATATGAISDLPELRV